jgi:hypothetical protein
VVGSFTIASKQGVATPVLLALLFMSTNNDYCCLMLYHTSNLLVIVDTRMALSQQ